MTDTDKPDGGTPSPEAEAKPEADKKIDDQLLRLRADLENARKRLERDKAEAIRYANERLIVEILPIVDNLDRAMASLAEGHDPAKVKDGLKIAQDQLHEVLERHGVEMVKTAEAEFDPRFHEAVAVVEDDRLEEGRVVDEIQKGYLLNGRLIRPSRVRVAKKKS